jgi:predicted GIY-YIG superfamily endonuclease
MTTIYILRLKGNNFYVGKTDDLTSRLKAHMDGNGSAWTKKFPVVEVDKVIEGASPFEEDKQVKEYMAKHGIDKVRGGSYSSCVLSEDQVYSIQQEIRGAADLCSECGKAGHFVRDCPKNRKTSSFACLRCGRKGHNVHSCYAKTDVDGYEIDSEEDDSEDDEGDDDDDDEEDFSDDDDY